MLIPFMNNVHETESAVLVQLKPRRKRKQNKKPCDIKKRPGMGE